MIFRSIVIEKARSDSKVSENFFRIIMIISLAIYLYAIEQVCVNKIDIIFHAFIH